MPDNMLWSVCFAICLISSCSGGLLRVPKVYNAIISSDTNLTPSRAYPLIQPVLHETALGYPLQPPLVYQQEFKPPFQKPLFQQDPESNEKPEETQPDSNIESKSPSENPSKENSPPTNKPQPPPKDDSLKLNQFGLPPSLIPINQYNPKLPYPYDPYTYNPYFSDPYSGIVLPYNNIYNPYYQSFPQNFYNPYLVHPSLYSPQQPSDQPEPWNNQNFPQQPQPQPQPPNQQQQPEESDKQPKVPNTPPPNLNVKNNSNKNSDIPDVPPPPLPVGGLKQDNKKSSNH